ncbi:hypothetical protein DFH11DRAFT_1732686 [Phellopilus nigrolimitatus]|nr:hypothetical protein DFH11DRAFT_1732686 [Phellopilus nigrolimitatus]
MTDDQSSPTVPKHEVWVKIKVAKENLGLANVGRAGVVYWLVSAIPMTYHSLSLFSSFRVTRVNPARRAIHSRALRSGSDSGSVSFSLSRLLSPSPSRLDALHPLHSRCEMTGPTRRWSSRASYSSTPTRRTTGTCTRAPLHQHSPAPTAASPPTIGNPDSARLSVEQGYGPSIDGYQSHSYGDADASSSGKHGEGQKRKSDTDAEGAGGAGGAGICEAGADADMGPFPAQLSALAQLVDPKSLHTLEALGSVDRLLHGLGTDARCGLSRLQSSKKAEPGGVKGRKGSGDGAPPAFSDAESGRTRRTQTISACTGRTCSPSARAKSLLLLMWLALKDKVLVLLSIAMVVSLSLGLFQDFGMQRLTFSVLLPDAVLWEVLEDDEDLYLARLALSLDNISGGEVFCLNSWYQCKPRTPAGTPASPSQATTSSSQVQSHLPQENLNYKVSCLFMPIMTAGTIPETQENLNYKDSCLFMPPMTAGTNLETGENLNNKGSHLLVPPVTAGNNPEKIWCFSGKDRVPVKLAHSQGDDTVELARSQGDDTVELAHSQGDIPETFRCFSGKDGDPDKLAHSLGDNILEKIWETILLNRPIAGETTLLNWPIARETSRKSSGAFLGRTKIL